ncbi:MAG: cysteine--tRNA ligase [Candidatus Eremiobacteraeota bacterium]|nr:cysteine--tRNA ligase [Candidatus Eremiobacteraeota bacterium]
METFVPLREGDVRLYVCGLTPSAESHLGHARSFLFFDVLRRYLQHCGYRVTYVRNITDIDDRSIGAGLQTGVPWHDIVMEYYASFQRSMHALGVAVPDAEPQATHFVPQIIDMIRALMERDYAYVSRDGVYYRVSRFARYGDLSNRNIDELESGARIEVDESKDNPLDFALWKFSKPEEPKWPSPWGDGRPGWHIECSAMAHDLLDKGGAGFDIHGGGADLIFPHHENEIAQSEPLMEHPPMANVWMHGGLLLFENKKMSKSLGNFEPLSTLLKRHDPQAIRLLFLQTGYRKVMNFTEESVLAATTALRKLQSAWRRLGADTPSSGEGNRGALIAKIQSALDDDMNTSLAISEVLRFASDAQSTAGSERAAAVAQLGYALTLLGIAPNDAWLSESRAPIAGDSWRLVREAFPEQAAHAATIEDALGRIIALRTRAREAKDWGESDRIRDALAACGFVLADSKDGTTWTTAGA